MKYHIGSIVQFKTKDYLINNLNWNKTDAELASDKIGVIEECSFGYYKIRFTSTKDFMVISNDKGFFIPNGFINR